MTPAEALLAADANPTPDTARAYLLACARACIYDGGTMTLAARWRLDPQTVASLRRSASQEAGQRLTRLCYTAHNPTVLHPAKRTPP